MNFSDHFPRTKSFYNQNPHKVQFAAGVGVTTTVAASVLARVTSAPLPKTAKLTIFGLTFVSNLTSLNMKDASLGELAKVMMIGKNIFNNIIADVKNVAFECYQYIGEDQISNDANTNLTIAVLPVEKMNSKKDDIVKLQLADGLAPKSSGVEEGLAPGADIEAAGLPAVEGEIGSHS